MRKQWSSLAAGVALLSCAPFARAQCNDYTMTPSQGGVITPGDTNIGNHADDAVTAIALPFTFTFHNSPYTSVNASSNGNLQFASASNRWDNQCLPAGLLAGPAMMPYWDDLDTRGPGNGIYTTLTGSAPSRTFHIEWRAIHVTGGAPAHFQVRLHEDGRFEYVYAAGTGASATIGAQSGGAAGAFTHLVACNNAGLNPGDVITFECPASPSPTGVGAAAPSDPRADTDVLITVAVTPGTNPPSTGLTVTADLAAIGGAPARTLFDNGTNGDATPGDGVYSWLQRVHPAAPLGPVAIPFTVSDAQARSSTGQIALTIQPAAVGACCVNRACSITTQAACLAARGVYLGDNTDCVTGLTTVTYTATAGLPASIPQPPDGQSGVTPGTASVVIDIPPGSGQVRALVVRVGLSHSWMGDVKAQLNHQDATVTLIDRAGVINYTTENGWQCNYDGVYVFADGYHDDLWTIAAPLANETNAVVPPGSYHPSGQGSGAFPTPNLGVFDGQPFAGPWTLTVGDWWALDAGQIESFELTTAVLYQCPAQCGTSDFNNDGDSGTDQDVEAFFACLTGTCCDTCYEGGADFNGDGDTGTDQDVEAFFRVLAGHSCE